MENFAGTHKLSGRIVAVQDEMRNAAGVVTHYYVDDFGRYNDGTLCGWIAASKISIPGVNAPGEVTAYAY